jgi:hypothetical protein
LAKQDVLVMNLLNVVSVEWKEWNAEGGSVRKWLLRI